MLQSSRDRSVMLGGRGVCLKPPFWEAVRAAQVWTSAFGVGGLLTLYSWGASWGVLLEGLRGRERETFQGLGAGPIY